MKYALISDIHGNYPALKAVVEDARAQNADHFLFLGDYVEDLPYPNECVDFIRSLSNATIIRGNKEDYLYNLSKENRQDWIHEQYAPLYWNVKELTEENLSYLINLPAKAQISDDSGYSILLNHSCPSLFGYNPRIDAFHSSTYPTHDDGKPLSHQEHLKFSRKELQRFPMISKELFKKQNTINVFGHNHMQWHMQQKNSLLVNPGSCGVPCDHNPKASYTILVVSRNGVEVLERRVLYDINRTIQELFASSLFKEAEIWCRIIVRN